MSGLNFQDFNVDLVGSSNSPFTNNSQSKKFSQSSSSKTDDNIGGSGSENAGGPKKPHFLTFGFYQQYFDVDTIQVQSRILHSFLPIKTGNFISDHVQPMPDLYGPFWICVTLIFSIGIFGNIAHYIQNATTIGNSYENDFGLVTSATTLIVCYVIIVPFAIYSFMWHRKTLVQYSYMEMVCAYGYSLAIFVPVSILWVVELQWFRWTLIVMSVVASGTVLIGSFWPVVKSDPSRIQAFAFVAAIILLHTLLAVGFKEFYFDPSMPANAHSDVMADTTHKIDMISLTFPPSVKSVGLNNKSRIVVRALSVHNPIVSNISAHNNDTLFVPSSPSSSSLSSPSSSSSSNSTTSSFSAPLTESAHVSPWPSLISHADNNTADATTFTNSTIISSNIRTENSTKLFLN